jgi:hypothetical protein
MLCSFPNREPRHNRQSTSVEIRSFSFRLFASRTGVHVDLHADRHFDNFWSLPSHLRSPLKRNGILPDRSNDRTTPEIAQADFLHAPSCNGSNETNPAAHPKTGMKSGTRSKGKRNSRNRDYDNFKARTDCEQQDRLRAKSETEWDDQTSSLEFALGFGAIEPEGIKR